MALEFKVRRYPNTADGQASKIADLTIASRAGWEIVSEIIEQEGADPVAAGRDAACLCFMCGPFCTPFLMNKNKYKPKSTIVVTLQRTLERKAQEEQAQNIRREEKRMEFGAMALDESANIEFILAQAKKESGTFYPNSKIVNAIEKYLNEVRQHGDPVPSYNKTSVEDDVVIVRDPAGDELFRQQF